MSTPSPRSRTVHVRARFLLLAALCISSPVLANALGLERLEARDIREVLALYNRSASDQLPLLDADQVQRLLEGEVVKLRETPNGSEAPQRVVGFFVLDAPRSDVWIAATDPHASYSGGLLKETRLVEDATGGVWYQHLKLPWPVQDRHWLIRIRRNADLAAKSKGLIWEHAWSLDENGETFIPQFIQSGHIADVSLEVAQKSIYTPVNHGAWITIAMPEDRTLLVYHVTSVVGGSIPDSFVAEWSMLTLEKLLREVGEYARGIPAHYVGDHPIFVGADGIPLPLHSAN